jgi:hypothetical protein
MTRVMLLLALMSGWIHSQDTGTLSILSEPGECWVRIDSLLVGKTPLTDLELGAGDHRVAVYPPHQGVWNIEQQVFDISVSPGRHSEISARFSTPVFINSIPYDASLNSDTLILGSTPLYLPFDHFRGREFRLEKAGYKPYVFTLNEPGSILAELERADGYIAHEKKPPLFGVIPRQHFKSRFSLLALSVITHWASFYFKNVADSNYDKYQMASDTEKINRYWDNTRKYDRISDITLGISYASLAGLIYMVMWK